MFKPDDTQELFGEEPTAMTGTTDFEKQVLTDLATIKEKVTGHAERLKLVEAKVRFHDRIIWMLAGAGGVLGWLLRGAVR
jgi:hypothetical protein